MCGVVGNCSFWVVQVSQNGYQVLLSTSVTQTFAILNTSTAGYYESLLDHTIRPSKLS